MASNFAGIQFNEWLAFVSAKMMISAHDRKPFGPGRYFAAAHCLSRCCCREWLSSAFGFVEHYRYGESSGAQSIWATPGSWSAKRVQGKQLPRNLAAGRKVSRCLVEDVGAHYKGQEPRAKIVEELNETPYGEFQYGGGGPRGPSLAFRAACTRREPRALGRKAG